MGTLEVFIPIAGIITFAVIISFITRLIATSMHHRTIREAMRSDPSSVPMLVQRLEARQPWADAMLGWIFIAFTIGIALLAITDSDVSDRREMLRAAIVPLIIGITVLAFTHFASRQNAGTP